MGCQLAALPWLVVHDGMIESRWVGMGMSRREQEQIGRGSAREQDRPANGPPVTERREPIAALLLDPLRLTRTLANNRLDYPVSASDGQSLGHDDRTGL